METESGGDRLKKEGEHGIVNLLHIPHWLAFSIVIFPGENILLIFCKNEKKLYHSEWKSLVIGEECVFLISVNMSYFKMSKVAWQMTLRPHFPRWLALAFWPTEDVCVYTRLQSRDTTPPFWNWSQWQENSQTVGYLSTDTAGIHPLQEQQQRFRTTYWQTERASFFFPSQLTTDFSDLGVSLFLPQSRKVCAVW